MIKLIAIQATSCVLKVLLLTLAITCNVFASSGDIDWGGWKFSYTSENNVGLELNNVHFNERKILHRASFPVMRVEYGRQPSV